MRWKKPTDYSYAEYILRLGKRQQKSPDYHKDSRAAFEMLVLAKSSFEGLSACSKNGPECADANYDNSDNYTSRSLWRDKSNNESTTNHKVKNSLHATQYTNPCVSVN